MADTKLDISQIELGIAELFNFRLHVVVPRVSWGLLNHEADIIAMNASGYLTEVEIKRSWSDFLADFRKEHAHNDSRVMWRYFAVPESILAKCEAKLKEKDPWKTWGLMYYRELRGVCDVQIKYFPSNINSHNRQKKLSAEEQFKLARLGAMRIWGERQKQRKKK